MAKRKLHNYNGVDLTGKRHGRLTAIRKANKGITQWICKCDCGNEVIVTASKFFIVQSCGCFERENQLRLRFRKTHGMSETRLYGIWCGVKDRCTNQNAEHYDRYGGRGIKICKEWEHSFEAFRDWAISAGYDETKTGKEQSIDRIDVDGDYCPENCRWISMKEQLRNRSDTLYIDTKAGRVSIREFCEKNHITYVHFVVRYLNRGFTAEELLKVWKFQHGEHAGYYSMQEAETKYNLCSQSIMQRIKSGKLKAEKVGNSWFIPCGQVIN